MTEVEKQASSNHKAVSIEQIIQKSSDFAELSLEITPTIGCAMICEYCPQSLLKSRYVSHLTAKGSNQKHMTLAVLKKILDNCPNDIIIHWTGFVEPLMSPNICELLFEVTRRGLSQFMNTTLYGATEKKIDLVFSGDMCRLNLHLPDDEGLMKLDVNEKYLNILEYTLTRMRPNIDRMHFIGKPHSKILSYLENSPAFKQIHTDGGIDFRARDFTLSRASNLDEHKNTQVLSTTSRSGNYSCASKRFTQPNVLPNGTLVLCCMDYGLEEIHGNLIDKPLLNLLENGLHDLARRIYTGNNNLCSKCEWLVPDSTQ